MHVCVCVCVCVLYLHLNSDFCYACALLGFVHILVKVHSLHPQLVLLLDLKVQINPQVELPCTEA